MARRIRLLRQTAGDPVLDTAVSRTILDDVSVGHAPETLRVYRPQPNVAFGRHDAVTPGYAEAVRAARARGFEAVERLAGGRAAVFHEDTIAFAWAVPDPHARERIRHRFDDLAATAVRALRRLGVDARAGEVPGEYCPGEFSVNARGERKLVGVGQRIVRDAAHVGGVVVVDGSERVNDVLLPVYEALSFAWRPDATGSVASEVPDVGFGDVVDALLEELGARYELAEEALDPELLRRAEARRHEFVPSVLRS